MKRGEGRRYVDAHKPRMTRILWLVLALALVLVGPASMARASDTGTQDETQVVQNDPPKDEPKAQVAVDEPKSDNPTAAPKARVQTQTINKPSFKVGVCKYVGKPGDDERLQTYIEVAGSTLKGWDGSTFPWEFTDAQGQSIAIGWADKVSKSDCPAGRTFKAYDAVRLWLVPASVGNPNGKTVDASFFPQPKIDFVPCDRWGQKDTYPIESKQDERVLDSLGDLLEWVNGHPEDSAIYGSHRFIYGGDCEKPKVTVAEPTFTPGTCLAAGSVDAKETDNYSWQTTGPATARIYTAVPKGDVVLDGQTVFGPYDLSKLDPNSEACKPVVKLDFSTKCGAITLTTDNNANVPANWYYGLKGSVDGATVVSAVQQGPGHKESTKTFDEDFNGGSVVVDVTVYAATEQDLLPEAWPYGKVVQVTVNTNCLPDEVTPITPEWNVVCGPDGNDFWSVDGHEVKPGESYTLNHVVYTVKLNKNGSQTITASPEEGYTFPEGTKDCWTKADSNERCVITDFVEAFSTAQKCVALDEYSYKYDSGAVVIADNPKMTVTLDGTPVQPGTHDAEPGNHVVVYTVTQAAADAGFAFDAQGTLTKTETVTVGAAEACVNQPPPRKEVTRTVWYDVTKPKCDDTTVKQARGWAEWEFDYELVTEQTEDGVVYRWVEKDPVQIDSGTDYRMRHLKASEQFACAATLAFTGPSNGTPWFLWLGGAGILIGLVLMTLRGKRREA